MNYKGLAAAFFYGFMSVASVFINKAIFHVYDFKFPYTLVFGQTLFTLVLLTAMRSLHIIRMAPFQFSVLHRVGGGELGLLLHALSLRMRCSWPSPVHTPTRSQ